MYGSEGAMSRQGVRQNKMFGTKIRQCEVVTAVTVVSGTT